MNLRTIQRWGPGAVLSLVDQGTFALANMMLNILLARWISLEEYGAFAAAFMLFVFLSGVHNALILEPLSVIGPARYGTRLRPYVVRVFGQSVRLTVGLGLLLAAAGYALRSVGNPLGTSLMGAALLVPCALQFWLLRRAAYLNTRPAIAASASVLYGALLAVGLWGLSRSPSPGALEGFLLLSGASVVATAALWVPLLRGLPDGGPPLAPSEPRTDHWRYGRWVLGTAFLGVFSSTLFIPMLSLVGGYAVAGAYRMVEILFLPVQQLVVAAGTLMTPRLARHFAAGEVTTFHRQGRRLGLGLGTLAAIYGGALIASGEVLLPWVYGEKSGLDQVRGLAWALPLFALVMLFRMVNETFFILLRARLRPESIFLTSLLGSALALAVAAPLTLVDGLRGAVTGMACLTLVQFALLAALYRKMAAPPLILQPDFVADVGFLPCLGRWIVRQCTKRLLRRDNHIRLPNGREMILSRKDSNASEIYVSNANMDWGSEHILAARLPAEGVFLDVGAHIGYYALLCDAPERTTYAFEPDPRNVPLLRANIEPLPHIHLVQRAVSDREGTVPFAVGGDSAMSAIAPDGEDPAGRTISVECTTLDRFSEGVEGRVAGIKIDIEGHDLAALRGARGILRRDRPLVLTEFNLEGENTFPDLEALLEETGYLLWALCRREPPKERGKILCRMDAALFHRGLHKMLFLVPKEEAGWFEAREGLSISAIERDLP